MESTNQYALDLLSKSKPSEGTVISTVNQTAGRGQMGNSWESNPGENLTLSIIFYPHFLHPERQFKLNKAISLGVLEGLEPFVPQGAWIKWPNDIYADDKKLAGILIQNALSGQRIQSSVAGIGINVNQLYFQLNPSATSLRMLRGETCSLQAVRDSLFAAIEKRYLQLRNTEYQTLREEYLNKMIGYRQWRTYRRRAGPAFSGKITGIDDKGRLLMQHHEITEAFDLKEIEWIF